MKHTKGPWIYEKATETIRSKPSNHWLATMDSWDGAVNHDANALLISASPDLLESCKEMLFALDNPRAADAFKRANLEHGYMAIKEHAKKAIAKAEGR